MQGYPKGFDDWPELMDANDLAKAFYIHPRTASDWMNEDGFPLVRPGARRNRKVNKFRLIKYLRGENE